MKIIFCKTMTPLVAMVALTAPESASGFASTSFTGRSHATLQSTEEIVTVEATDGEEQTTQAVRVPLKFLGPYPCMGLRFPDLATSSQREKNVTGISLDFVLDSAANVNTLNAQVAQELDLEVVGEALPGVGAGGAIQGGDTFMLGSAELEGISKEEQFTFMEGLTASALPVASPAAAGLLSLAFFHCFEGGVEFQWGSEGVPPSVTFYGDGESDSLLESMTRVPIDEQPVSRLPAVEVTINGVTFPALLDTGSPITVLNAQAAEQAGVKTVQLPSQKTKKGGNPFTNFANRFQEAQEAAQAAARGDVIAIAGTAGERVNLVKSEAKNEIILAGMEGKKVEFGESNVYVGNLPGLAALNALGDDSPPAAILGMDVLRLKPKMLLKAQSKEVYF